MDNKFGTGRVLENMGRLKRDLPRVLANQAQRFFVQRFDDSAWEDRNREPWDIPKRRIDGTTEYKYPKSKDLGRRTRATLVKTGTLRRAVNMSAKVISFESILFVVAVPYAHIHNEGGPAKAFGKHAFTMPKRRFMGDSVELRHQQVKLIHNTVDRIWKS